MRIADSGHSTFIDWYSGGGIDFTFGDLFQVGVSGGIDYIVADNLPVSLASELVHPGAELRLVFLLGTKGPGARGAVAIGLRQHLTFLDPQVRGFGVLSYTLATAGFELF